MHHRVVGLQRSSRKFRVAPPRACP